MGEVIIEALTNIKFGIVDLYAIKEICELPHEVPLGAKSNI